MKLLEGQMSFDGRAPRVTKRLNDEQGFVLRQLLMAHPRGLNVEQIRGLTDRTDVNGFLRRLEERNLVVRQDGRVTANSEILREDW